MELPWVNEVRAARSHAERTHTARLLLEELVVLGRQLEILERTSSTEDLSSSLQDALERASALLDDVTSADRQQEIAASLADRKSAVVAAQNMLRPLADQQEEAAHALHDLQHRQQHDLAHPKYAEETAALRQVWEERGTIAEELPLAERQSAVLRPVMDVIGRCLSSLAALPSTDATTANMVRTRYLEGCVQSVASVMDAAGMSHDVTSVLAWPEGNTPTEQQLDDTMTRLRSFAEQQRSIGDELQARVKALQARDAALEQMLLERLG